MQAASATSSEPSAAASIAGRVLIKLSMGASSKRPFRISAVQSRIANLKSKKDSGV
jgi:hypothetical protein